MIRVKHSTGNDYYRGRELTSYTTVWTKDMATTGGIRFYDGELALVADFHLGEISDETIVYAYPHNDKNALLSAAEAHEAEIRGAISAAMKSEPGRDVFTFDLAGGEVKLLLKEHFNRYTSKRTPCDELFTFDNPDPRLGFPRLFCHTKASRSSVTYGDVFMVLAKVSRFVFPPAKNEEPTEDGKRFTYMIYNSYINMEFKDEVPNLHGVYWPTRESCDIPGTLDTYALEKFLIDVGIDKVVFDANGKLVSLVSVADIEDEESADDKGEEWDDVDMPLFELNASKESQQTLAEMVWGMIENKGYFNIADAFSLGFEKLLSMVPISEKIIPANIDFPALVHKMCIYRGLYYIIPFSSDAGDANKVADLLDIAEESVKLCTNETYPKHNSPLLPAETY